MKTTSAIFSNLPPAGGTKTATEATPHSRTHRDKISQGLVGSFNSTS